MCLDMLLQVLRTLESLPTEIAFVGFEWYMHSDVGGYVVTLDSRSTTIAPLASQVQVIGALAPDMSLADVVLRKESARLTSTALEPSYIE